MKKLFCYEKKDFCDRYKGDPAVNCGGCEFFDDTGSEEREVDEAEGSSADVVEVIRCKDCKHRHSSEFCECRPDDAFCSDGERKE